MSNLVMLPKYGSSDTVKALDSTGVQETQRQVQYSITKSYINALGFDVAVVDRNNTLTVVQSMPTILNTRREFVVQVRINFTNAVKINIDHLLDGDNDSKEIKAFKTAMSTNVITAHVTNKEYVIEYAIKASSFIQQGSCVYYEDLDIVLATVNNNVKPVHPFSPLGQALIIRSYNNESGFGYNIVINDPDGVFGDRYININNRIFKIKASFDGTLKTGVHLFTQDEYDLTTGYDKSVVAEHYSFAQAEESLCLWKTPTQAIEFGDALKIKQAEFTRLQDELKVKEAELKHKTVSASMSKVNLEHETKSMEYINKQQLMKLEMENQRLQDELNKQKAERERIINEEKYEFERRSMNRKDSSEFMKWLPGIVTGAIGIISLVLTAYIKYRPLIPIPGPI